MLAGGLISLVFSFWWAMILISPYVVLIFTDFSQYFQNQEIVTDENLQFEDFDEQSLSAEEVLWFESQPERVELETVGDYSFVTTPQQPHVVKEQGGMASSSPRVNTCSMFDSHQHCLS